VSDLWPLSAAALALVVMVGVLVHEGVFLDAETRTLRRLRVRLGGRRTVADAVLERSGLLSLLQNEADIRQLQAVAGRGSDPRAFLGKAVRICVAVMMIPAAGDAYTMLNGGDALVAPLWLPAFGVGGLVLAFADLRQTARRRRDEASRSIAKMLLLFGMTNATPLRSGERIDSGDPLLLLAGAMRQPALRAMLQGEGWHRLVNRETRSRAELLEALGAAYRIPLLLELGGVVRNVQEYGGTDPGREYIVLARTTFKQWLADARVRLASRGITVLVPAAGMLLAIFVVLFSAIAYASSHGGL
jgi:hypothetical protein